MRDGREKRIEIFEDSMKLCRSNERLKGAIREAKEKQKVFLEGADDVPAPAGGGGQPAQIIVSKKRSFEAAQEYARAGKKVCVHNFASASNPGGGVEKGSSAQEECLCRISTLYPCISEPKTKAAFHDAHRAALRSGVMDSAYNDDCIYTPGVVVFKEDTDAARLLPEEDWITVDVITCAAPNMRRYPGNAMNPDSGRKQLIMKDSALTALHKKRMERILSIAAANGAKVVILGAFGCGAFQNPPLAVAQGLRQAIAAYENAFETIELAVYCNPQNTANYDVFRRVFAK